MKRLRSNLALAARPAPDYVDARSLAAGGAAESLTVPGTAGQEMIAVFSYSAGPVYVRYGAAPTAATPGDTTDGTASEAMPTAYEVVAGQLLSFQSPVAAVVTVAYYNSAAGR